MKPKRREKARRASATGIRLLLGITGVLVVIYWRARSACEGKRRRSESVQPEAALSASDPPLSSEVEVSRPEFGALLSAAGIVALGAVRASYESYYRELDVLLDEVGLTNWRLAGLATWSVLVIAGVLIIPSWASTCFWRGMARDISASISKYRWAAWAAAVALTLLVWVVGAFIGMVILASAEGVAFAALTLAGLIAVIAPFLESVRRRPLPRHASIVGALTLVIASALVWSLAWLQADDAARLLDNPSGEKSWVTGIVLDVSAPRVCVRFIAPPSQGLLESGPYEGSVHLFLGRSEGIAVVYDPGRRRVFRVSTEAIVLEGTDDDQKSC